MSASKKMRLVCVTGTSTGNAHHGEEVGKGMYSLYADVAILGRLATHQKYISNTLSVIACNR